MSIDVTPTSLSLNFSPYALARELELSHPREDVTRMLLLQTEENDWAASFFLAALLRKAKRRRQPINRERARQILSRETTAATIDKLEDLGFVRFVLDRLEIPAAVSHELRFEQHPDKIASQERTALQQLVIALQDATATLWICSSQLRELHGAHTLAHPRTPSIAGLEEARFLVDSSWDAEQGYDLLLQDRSSRWRSILGARALGLYWEALGHSAPAELDDAHFSEWLGVAIELPDWPWAPDFVRPELRERLINAASRRIRSEPDLRGRDEELKRMRWDHDGYGFHGQPSYRPFPEPSEGLCALYEWWEDTHVHHTNPQCRKNLDCLIRLVPRYEQDAWGWKTVELLRESDDRPYLLHAIAFGVLLGSPSRIAGMIANLETASVGLHLLTRLTIRQDNSAAWRSVSLEHLEARKTDIWRQGIDVFLAMLLTRLQEGEQAPVARTLAEAMLATASATSLPGRPSDANERRTGSETRLSILLEELSRTAKHLLFKVIPDLRVSILARAKQLAVVKRNVPVVELRLLFWLLRTLQAHKSDALARQLAGSILDVYVEVMRRERAGDGSPLWWSDNQPDTTELPWHDMIAVLTESSDAQRFVGLEGIDFDSLSRVAPGGSASADSTAAHQLSRAWLMKARLHLRVLIAIQGAIHGSTSEIVAALSSERRDELLALVGERIRTMVQTLGSGRRGARELSLFNPNGLFRVDEPESVPDLLDLVIHAFNCLPDETRNRAFVNWVDVESDPEVLLTVLRDATPIVVKQTAASELKKIKVDDLLASRLSVADVERIARAAAQAPDQAQLADQLLAYGDKLVRSGYRKEWELFAFRTRLQIAFHKKDAATVRSLPAPEGVKFVMDGEEIDTVEDVRSFYLALCMLDEQPEQARQMFGTLLRRGPSAVAEAVNWFSAGVSIAKRMTQNDERRRAFVAALRDWGDIASNLAPQGFVNVSTTVATLRLIALDGAGQHADFDMLWSQFDPGQRAELEVVDVAVANAASRGLRDRVNQILDHARPYHCDQSANLDARFVKIEREARASTVRQSETVPFASTPFRNLELLRRSLLELRSLSAEDQVRVVGTAESLHEYLAISLYRAAAVMLDRAVLLERLAKEDDLNDLMVSFVGQQLSFLGWHVSDQSRGGRSASGKSAGRRDFVIKDNLGNRAIIEALRWRGETGAVKEHLERAARNYNTIGVQQVYLITYFREQLWSQFWARYWGYAAGAQIPDLSLLESETNLPFVSANNVEIGRVTYAYPNGELLKIYHLALNVGPSEHAGED